MVVHVRYDGRSVDLPFQNLEVGDQSSDQRIRDAVAQRLNESANKFDGYIVDRNLETGDVTVRPQAVFG